MRAAAAAAITQELSAESVAVVGPQLCRQALAEVDDGQCLGGAELR